MVKLILAFVCLTALGVATAPKAAAASHAFTAYPAPVYSGPVRQPAFRGSQRDYAAFRTQIRQSVAQGSAFAGHYAIAVVGCGTSCRFGYITDLKTGLVYDLPYGGEESYDILYRVRRDSRLLQVQLTPVDEKAGPQGCVLEDFVWTGRRFKSLGRQRTDEVCPGWNDYAG